MKVIAFTFNDGRGTSKVTGLRAKSIVYIDSEIGIDDKRIKDLGAIKNDRSSFHSASLRDFYAFISGETDILLPFVRQIGIQRLFR